MELFGLQTEASATAIVTTLLLLNLAQTSGRGVSGIPGPVGYPFFGNHFALVGPKRHATLRSWADKYGGVFKVHGIWGSSPFVVVSDPESARAPETTARPARHRIPDHAHRTPRTRQNRTTPNTPDTQRHNARHPDRPDRRSRTRDTATPDRPSRDAPDPAHPDKAAGPPHPATPDRRRHTPDQETDKNTEAATPQPRPPRQKAEYKPDTANPDTNTVLCDLNIPKYNQKYNSVNEMLHGQRLPSMYTSPTAGPYWKAVRKCVVHAFSAAEVEEDFEVAKLKMLASKLKTLLVAEQVAKLKIQVLAEQRLQQDAGVFTNVSKLRTLVLAEQLLGQTLVSKLKTLVLAEQLLGQTLVSKLRTLVLAEQLLEQTLVAELKTLVLAEQPLGQTLVAKLKMLVAKVAKLKTLVLAEQLMEQGSGVSTDMHAAALRLSLDVLGLSKFGYDFHATEGKGTPQVVKLLKECSVEKMRLVVTGHSLGAGVGALLALYLKQRYAQTVCWAFAPPGGLMSPQVAESMRPYCTSVVIGVDIISRLSLHSMRSLNKEILDAAASVHSLNKEILDAAACCKVSKASFWFWTILGHKWSSEELFKSYDDVDEEVKIILSKGLAEFEASEMHNVLDDAWDSMALDKRS
eukprot:gene1840-33258_t